MDDEETFRLDEQTIASFKARDAKKSRRCLVITPIGPVDSDIRRATDGMFDEVVAPVCQSLNYEAEVSHRMNDPGSIMDQVVSRLIEYELVIADLTHNNPNVTYELAIRHAAKRPVICLHHTDSKLPFDLQGERVITYQNDMQGAFELKKALSAMILAIEAAPSVVDNPVVRGAKTFTLTTHEVPQTEFQAIMRRLDVMERRFVPMQQAAPADSRMLMFVATGSKTNTDRFEPLLDGLWPSRTILLARRKLTPEGELHSEYAIPMERTDEPLSMMRLVEDLAASLDLLISDARVR